MNWMARLDQDTFRKVSFYGFVIEFNWRGFLIYRLPVFSFQYRLFGIRWWTPKIIYYESYWSTTTGR